MSTMIRTRGLTIASLALALAGLLGAAPSAMAQDRVVGRDALDHADQDRLGPAVDGRTDSPEEVDPGTLEAFDAPLAPYGTWVDDDNYGRVWVPHEREVGPDFYPYSTGGRWELTHEGDWIWVSDYRWGDIPFHYGRWVWIDSRGWSWVPGSVWAPAWVVWRTGPYGVIGWAPYPPTWGWWGGTAAWLWWPPPAAYVFVQTRYVFDRHVHRHHIHDRARAQRAAAQTSPQHRPQHEPARPGAPQMERNRPASPDLEAIRYDGPTPTLQPKQPRREFGASGGPRGLTPHDRSVRPASRSGFTPRNSRGRFSPASPQDRWGRASRSRDAASPTGRGDRPTTGRPPTQRTPTPTSSGPGSPTSLPSTDRGSIERAPSPLAPSRRRVTAPPVSSPARAPAAPVRRAPSLGAPRRVRR